MTCLVFGAVFANGIQMGVQADYEGPIYEQIYHVLDNVFTGVFAFEFFVKVISYGKAYWKSAWNLFDFVLTWMSIVDLWILSALGASSGMKSLAVLRVLRIFRIFRAMRLLRMLHNLRELAMIIEGLFNAASTTGWVSILLILMLYIVSIFCCRYVGYDLGIYEGYSRENEDLDAYMPLNSYQYFGKMTRAMYTLLNVALLTDDWFIVSRAILERQPAILVPLLLFVAFTTFGLLNVIMAIIVGNVMDVAKSMSADEDSDARRAVLSKLDGLYDFVFSLDEDGDGEISVSELVKAWDLPEMKDLVSIVRMPIGSTAEELIDLIDTSGDGKLEIEEFVQVLVRLLTSETFQHILEIKSQQNRLKRDFKKLRNDVCCLPDRVRKEAHSELQKAKNDILTAIREELGVRPRVVPPGSSSFLPESPHQGLGDPQKPKFNDRLCNGSHGKVEYV